jgi:hypothetical protein
MLCNSEQKVMLINEDRIGFLSSEYLQTLPCFPASRLAGFKLFSLPCRELYLAIKFMRSNQMAARIRPQFHEK